VQWDGIHIDITDRKVEEERFKKTAHDLIVRKNDFEMP